VNRWQAWAGRLRQRHSRIDAWRAQGAMVLLRAVGAHAPTMGHSVRSIDHWHTRLSISPRFMLSLQPALAAPRVLQMAAREAKARTAQRDESPTGTASPSSAQGASFLAPRSAAAPAFVPRMTAHARAMLLPPQAAPILLSVHQRETASPVAAHAGEIASRLRRNVARQELPSAAPAPAPAAVLAAPQRAAARAAATEAQAVVQAAVQAGVARQHTEAPRFAQPAPSINVEALTGLVIQQIDRRLVAYRERMGRA
jgi:hypothetical protein